MSIHAISGKPGGGKSLFGMKALVQELRTTDRYVVTNLALKLPELCDWLHKHYESSFNALQRITVMDEEQTKKFWLYRGNGLVLPDTEQNDFSSADAGNVWFLPNAEWVSGLEKRGGAGVCYILDELHLFFNAREWAKTGKGAIFYLSQHRKCMNDVIWITQHIENVDKQFRSLTQDFTYVRNYAKEKFASHFRSLPWFGYKVFQSPVTATSVNMVPSETGRFLLDAKGLAACYDTAKGVGFAGNVAADTKEGKRGLPFFVIIPGIILLLVMVYFGITGGMRLLMNYVKRVPKVALHMPQANTNGVHAVPEVVPVGKPEVAVPSQRRERTQAVPDEDGTAMLGYACLKGVWYVMLSDGRTVRSDDPEFERLTEQGVKYAGRYYRRVIVSHEDKGSVREYSAQVPSQTNHVVQGLQLPERVGATGSMGAAVDIHWRDGSVTHQRVTTAQTSAE